MQQGLRVIGASAALAAITLLPFLPGSYDVLAVHLSLLTQLFGKIGLLLIPFALLWLASLHHAPLAGKRRLFATLAAAALSLVLLILSIAGMTLTLTLGLALLILSALVVSKVLRADVRPATPLASATPLYLIALPATAALVPLLLSGPATEFGRNRAIGNSAPMIHDIEQYRISNGHYPRSVMSVWKDYKPGVIGIDRYQYEPKGEAYNLMFEQATFGLGTREFVMYNPLDQHGLSSHAMDVLQMTPEQLALDQTRGHNAVRDAGHAHWKSFIFD